MHYKGNKAKLKEIQDLEIKCQKTICCEGGGKEKKLTISERFQKIISYNKNRRKKYI